MSIEKQPAIQGLSAAVPGGYHSDKYQSGDSYEFIVDSSNPFYTTKVSSLVIASTTYTAPTDPYGLGSMVVTFSGSPDLSEVMVGNYLEIITCPDHENIGRFPITAVNDGSDTITIQSRGGVTNASSSGSAETMPFVGAHSMLCLEDTTTLSVSSDSSAGASVPDLTAGNGMLGFYTEVTVSAGSLQLKLL